MRKALSLILAVLLLGFVFAYSDYSNYSDDSNRLIDNGGLCTMEYLPVCAEVQIQCIRAPCEPILQTYGNECMANAAGAKIIAKGECPLVSPPCACTKDYKPVCAVKYVPRPCECPTGAMCKCPTERVTQTYSNQCLADCERAEFLYGGVCEKDCPIYSPPYCPNGEITSTFDERGCKKPICSSVSQTDTCAGMDYSKAKTIALENCGELRGKYFCNEETSTWWFDLMLEMPSCAPACVVNAKTGEAEINYRCTGLIPGEKIDETVKCIFNDNKNPQTCNSSNGATCTTNPKDNVSTDSIASCSVLVSGEKGDKVTWKSSCGGYAYTVIDGDSEYAKFDCSRGEVSPCACTLEYAPVCAEVKICTTSCKEKMSSTSNEQSYSDSTCSEYCYIEKQTFGNKCAANCEGAQIISRGECFQDSCPSYEMPYCPNGKIVMKEDGQGCKIPKCVESQSDFYTSAKWNCSDGTEEKISDTCLPYSYWKEYAKRDCASKSTKCSVQSTTSTESTSTNPISSVGNFLLEIVAPAETTTNETISVETETKCIGGEVYVTGFEVLNPCDPQCKVKINDQGCKEVTCENGEVTTYCEEVCPKPPYEEIRALKDKCYASGGEVLINTDNQGCERYACSTSELSGVCRRVEDVPKEKYLSCEEYGGKLIIKTNKDGCITVFECVGENKIDLNAKINKNILNDQTKLLGLALSLETLKMEVNKIKMKIASIQDYYEEQSDSNMADKYERAIELLEQIESKIDSAKQLIKDNVSNFDEEKAIQLRELIKTIKEEKLKEVLLVLLE